MLAGAMLWDHESASSLLHDPVHGGGRLSHLLGDVALLHPLLMEGPDLAVEHVLEIARRPAALDQGRFERLGIWAREPARLLEMDLEAGPFRGFVVLGAAECDHAIENVSLREVPRCWPPFPAWCTNSTARPSRRRARAHSCTGVQDSASLSRPDRQRVDRLSTTMSLAPPSTSS